MKHFTCPDCKYIAVDNEDFIKDDIAVCPSCGIGVIFNDDLSVRKMTGKEFSELPDKNKKEMATVITQIRKRNGTI